MIFVSLDGGATKTVAALYNENEILKVSVGGPSNFRNIGLGPFRRNVGKVIRELIKGTDDDKIDKMTFALAGIKDSKESTNLIVSNIKKILTFPHMEFYNDGEAAFFCRFPKGEGIILAPGTGMVSYGIWEGRKVRSSGWGWFLGDEGGAFFIGKRAIQESVKVWDDRSSKGEYKQSRLPKDIKNFFRISEDREIINRVYKKKIDIREIASIAPLVSRAALEGDSLSMDIMDEAARESIKTVLATYEKLGNPEGIEISGYGGVFRSGKWYSDKIFGEVKSRLKKVRILEPLYGYEAIIGSIVMNLKNEGYTVDMNFINDLRNQLNAKIQELPKEDRRKYLFM